MRCLRKCSVVSCVVALFALVGDPGAAWVDAGQVSIPARKDNTLFEYDPSDPNSPLNSNGRGDFFSAGRNYSKSLLRRGLIQFDLSDIPTNAVVVPGTVELHLEVIDMPKKDTSGEARDFWLVRLQQDWGEGASEANAGTSSAGSGALAEFGDATWLHTFYNPAIHDPRDPNPADPGYWPAPGVLGADPVDPTIYGTAAGAVPAAPYLGPVVFRSGMEDDINAWLANPALNFGWLVLGDERVEAADRSSQRGFATHEHAGTPPRLTFTWHIVPEPAASRLLLLGFGLLGCWFAGVRRAARY